MSLSTIDQPWLEFKQPIVRELAFAIASPPLLDQWPAQICSNKNIDLPNTTFWQQHFLNYLPRLQQLDAAPEALQQHLDLLKSKRIGIRFEHLLGFWLLDDSYHPFKLLGQGIKRMQGKLTLGEIDFLILNKDTGQTEHWEVAIKFYLGEGNLAAQHWYGLNYQDSFARKMKHLCQHQFNISQVEEVKSKQIQLHRIDLQRAIIKGRLFNPLIKIESPDWLNTVHLNGFWGYTMPNLPTGFSWRLLYRSEWLVPRPDSQLNLDVDSCTLTPVFRANKIYWPNGMYVLLNAENKVILYYMLRISNKKCPLLSVDNTLLPNFYAADIFNLNAIL